MIFSRDDCPLSFALCTSASILYLKPNQNFFLGVSIRRGVSALERIETPIFSYKSCNKSFVLDVTRFLGAAVIGLK